ncbi:MAG TPA: histidine phosphatase family protein [Acidimicrobiales bacterium]|nr:histidine phosphatase family protein [Acidimicrobiales bacterium]
MARLLLLRHGQSTWNAEHRWQGMADPPLSSLGVRQAEQAGRWLAGAAPVFSVVAASDLRRSLRTAQIIADALGLGDVEMDPALRERDVGEWSGLTTEEIASRWPGDLEAWRGGRLSRPPGGEDDEALVRRVVPALDRLCSRPGGAVLVVTHGGAIRALERHLGVGSCTPSNLCGRWFWRDGSGTGDLRAGDVLSLPESVPLDVEAIAPL